MGGGVNCLLKGYWGLSQKFRYVEEARMRGIVYG